MNYRNRNVMITDAKDLNFFENTELDKDDFLLNCKNSVLDLSGDQPKALEHSADLLLSKICNANYNPAATCTLWERQRISALQKHFTEHGYLQRQKKSMQRESKMRNMQQESQRKPIPLLSGKSLVIR